ncbi:MAG: hypothetical protein ABI040_09370 [Rhodoferax sp.]
MVRIGWIDTEDWPYPLQASDGVERIGTVNSTDTKPGDNNSLGAWLKDAMGGPEELPCVLFITAGVDAPEVDLVRAVAVSGHAHRLGWLVLGIAFVDRDVSDDSDEASPEQALLGAWRSETDGLLTISRASLIQASEDEYAWSRDPAAAVDREMQDMARDFIAGVQQLLSPGSLPACDLEDLRQVVGTRGGSELRVARAFSFAPGGTDASVVIRQALGRASLTSGEVTVPDGVIVIVMSSHRSGRFGELKELIAGVHEQLPHKPHLVAAMCPSYPNGEWLLVTVVACWHRT